MSNHFKYEIKEVNLRVQLKGHEVPFSDDAWKRFESFSSSQKTIVRNNVMQRFTLKLNRNVVLPIVFGSVIILFSFLLFNFINIKNPNTESSAKIETKRNAIVSTQVLNKKNRVRSNPAIPAATAPEDSVLVINTEKKQTIAQTIVIIPNSLDIAKNTQPIVSNKDNFAAEHSANKTFAKSDSGKNEMDLNITAQIEESSTKKKCKKSFVVVTEPTEEEVNQVPPSVSQVVSPSKLEVQN